MHFLNYRLVIFLLVTVFGIVFSIPSFLQTDEGKKISLGLDLQGGLHMLLGVETQKAVEGTGIELSEIYIDNMAQQMVIATEQFNGSVLVSTNLFMDIISELASALVGSIGLIYSANIGDNYAMFEAAHGSAPQFAGQNKVNPTATVLSGAWMADYLGEREVRDASSFVGLPKITSNHRRIH